MNSLAWLWFVLQREERPPEGLLAGMFVVFLLVFVALYAYMAICLMKIAQKTNTENTWWAWVPVLNVFLMLNIARKPLWWFILFLLPFVNFIILILVWVGICQARGKSGALVIGLLLPVVNLIVLGYLAFAD